MRRFAAFSLGALLVTSCTDAVAPVPLLQPGAPSFANGSSDVTAPTLTALNLTPTDINTTDSEASVTMEFTVTDDLSGARLFCAIFNSPSGTRSVSPPCVVFSPSTSHSGSTVATFPRFSEAGTWSLVQVRIDDAAGNATVLSNADLVAGGFPTTIVVRNTIGVAIVVQPKAISTKAGGKIEVAILSAPDFDALREVDRLSLTFGRTGDEQSRLDCDRRGKDVDRNNVLDLICRFSVQHAGFQVGDSEAILRGRTVEGDLIEGRSPIAIKK